MNVRYLAKIGKRRDGREGSREVLRHVMEGIALPGRNETGIKDRVVDFETNLPYGFTRDSDSTMVAHALARHKQNKSARDVWHIILSGEDGKADLGTLRELRARFLNTYCGGKADWVSCVHGDHAHLHLHLVIANARRDTGKSFNLSHEDTVASIASLGFAEGMPNVLNAQGKVPFAWRKAVVGEGMSRKGSYSNVREANSLELANLIKESPGELLGAMIKSADVVVGYGKTGKPNLTYKKTKFSLRDINFFLGKAGNDLYLDTDFKTTEDRPVYVSACDLAALEHDATELAKLYEKPFRNALERGSVDVLGKPLINELADLVRFPSILKNMSKGPLGWLCQLVELCGGLSKGMDMEPWQR
jgi:hypothetical protein